MVTIYVVISVKQFLFLNIKDNLLKLIANISMFEGTIPLKYALPWLHHA